MPASVAASINPADMVPGEHLIDGSTIAMMIKQNLTGTTGLTALAGGGLSANTPIIQGYISEFTTVATTNDSCTLPPAVAGLEYEIVNSGAQTLRVYCQTANPNNAGAADTIIPLAGGTATYTAIPANAVGIFSAVGLGRWKSQNQ